MQYGIFKSFERLAAGFTFFYMLTFPCNAFSQDTLSTQRSLETILEKAVICDIDGLNVFDGGGFDGGPGDEKKKLEALGVTITEEPQHGGEIRYRFPPGLKIFGYEANEAVFSSPSTTIFFVNLRAASNSISHINKSLKLKSISKDNPGVYGHFNEFKVLYARKLNDSNGSALDIVFSGIGNSRDYVVIGCQNLSW